MSFIDDLTIGDLRKLSSIVASMFDKPTDNTFNPYTIGDNWFFRTVTHHLSGEILSVGPQEIVLKGGTVCWIADDGRFSDLFIKGEPSEKEPYGTQDVVVGRGSIIDATRLKVNIQVVQK